MTWTLRAQGYTPPDGGHVIGIEAVLVTSSALRRVGANEIAGALAALAIAGVMRRLDHFQVPARRLVTSSRSAEKGGDEHEDEACRLGVAARRG